MKNMIRRLSRTTAFALLAVIIATAAWMAVSAQDDQAAARAVLFYDTSEESRVFIQEKLQVAAGDYSEELLIMFVNVEGPDGAALLAETAEVYELSEEEQIVPALVIGEHYLSDPDTLTEELPTIIEEGLEAGGIDWPQVPSLLTAIEEAVAAATATAAAPTPTLIPTIDPNAPTPTPFMQPVARAVFFYGPDCEECDTLMDIWLPAIHKHYGSGLEIAYVDVSTDTGAEVFANVEGDVPALAFGDQIFFGEQIDQQFVGPLKEALMAGGADWPVIEGFEDNLDAFEVRSGDPVMVYAIMFYRPTCPYCHQLYTEELPPIFEQFGDRFEVLFANTETPLGSELFSAAAEAFAFDRMAVPTFIIGDAVIIGAGGQVARQVPEIIAYALNVSGIGLPAIPGLDDAAIEALRANTDPFGMEATPTFTPPPPTATPESGEDDEDDAGEMGDAGEAGAVVNAILFYSPTCPHCHTVIRDELPPLFEKYGDQFRVIYASTATDEGNRLYSEAADTLGFDRYVPVFVVGDQTFVGSGQLPQVLPDIIDEGIAAGGIDWPDLPLLEEVFDAIAANVDPLSE